jgi:hypothetical protein
VYTVDIPIMNKMQTLFNIGIIIVTLVMGVLIVLLCTGIIDPTKVPDLSAVNADLDALQARTTMLSDKLGDTPVLERLFVVDLASYDTDSFYPCKILHSTSTSNLALPLSFWIGLLDRTQATDDFNNCTVGGLISSAGWTDVHNWHDLYVANSFPNNVKKLYHGLYRDMRGADVVIYVRGGRKYQVRTNGKVELSVETIDGVIKQRSDGTSGRFNMYPVLKANANIITFCAKDDGIVVILNDEFVNKTGHYISLPGQNVATNVDCEGTGTGDVSVE